MLFYSKKNNGAVRLRGAADKNSVAFEPYYMDGDKEVKVQGHIAMREDGKIVDKVYYGDIDKSGIDSTIEEMCRKLTKRCLLAFLVISVINIICIFWDTGYNNYIYWGSAALCSLMLLSEAIVLNRERIKKNYDIRSFLKYLSAMNSVRNAYYKLGRVPSIQEARAASACSSESKYLNNTYFFSFICFVILYNVIFNVWLMALTLVVLILMFNLERKKKIYFWQVLIYSKPYTYHYKVAIKALEKALSRVDVKTITDYEE